MDKKNVKFFFNELVNDVICGRADVGGPIEIASHSSDLNEKKIVENFDAKGCGCKQLGCCSQFPKENIIENHSISMLHRQHHD